MKQWPLADEVARLIVTAARLEREEIGEIMSGRPASRARAYVFVALAHRFPTIDFRRIAKMCGARAGKYSVVQSHAQLAARKQHGPRWFNLDRLNEVIAALGWPPMTKDQSHIRRQAARPPDLPRRARNIDGGFVHRPSAYDFMRTEPLRPRRMPAARSSSVIEVSGEPQAGRSALDQRRGANA